MKMSQKIYTKTVDHNSYLLQGIPDLLVRSIELPLDINYDVQICDLFEIRAPSNKILIKDIYNTLSSDQMSYWKAKELGHTGVPLSKLKIVTDQPLPVSKRYIFIN